MKRVVALIILAAWMVNCGIRPGRKIIEPVRQPIFIHEDVGDEIDDIEREQYALFPGVDGFVKAILYVHPLGGYEWEIVTEDAKLIAFNEDPLAVEILADFIDRHEQILESHLDFERAWDIVDYDVLRQPITKKEVDRVMEQLKKRKNERMARGGLSGCVTGASLGCLIGYSARERPQDPDPFWWIGNLSDVPVVAIAIGAAVGAVAGLGAGALMIRTDAQQAIEVIREARKPRVLDGGS